MSKEKLWEASWTIESQLGKGGQGTTSAVRSKTDGKPGVLKVLRNQKSAQARARMCQEVVNLRVLHTSGAMVPAVYESNTDSFEDIETDLYGLPRFVDDPNTKDTGFGDPPIVDMGAYEFQNTSCPWDLHGDGNVGPGDLLILFGWWCCDPNGPPDFNGDGIVNTTDLLELFANWGECL